MKTLEKEKTRALRKAGPTGNHDQKCSVGVSDLTLAVEGFWDFKLTGWRANPKYIVQTESKRSKGGICKPPVKCRNQVSFVSARRWYCRGAGN